LDPGQVEFLLIKKLKMEKKVPLLLTKMEGCWEVMTMNGSSPRLIIAALRGGSGKTILSAGLCSLWRKQGKAIVPFKKGPDFIDAGWLARAAGHPCYNLDLFLMNRDMIVWSFFSRSRTADGVVIEGNRGLFDGLDQEGSFSTARLAKLIGAPVILVVDATKTTCTAAAMVMGCQKFDPELALKGVLLNHVSGARHEKILRGAIESHCGIPVLGSVPRMKGLTFYERHMGLVPPQEHGSVCFAIDEITGAVEEHVEGERLWEIACRAPLVEVPRISGKTPFSVPSTRPRIGVIRDSAFQFYYPENLEELERRGGQIEEISALNCDELPDVDALYIGGGFPETHAGLLAGNQRFRKSIRERAIEGLPVYAECGGLMYLGEAITVAGLTYPMAGVLPVVFGLETKPQGHGYTIVEVDRPNPFFEKGVVLKGHEFHYSTVLSWNRDLARLAFRMKRGQGFDENRDGLCIYNVLATYTHIHALGTPEWACSLISNALAYRQTRRSSRATELLA
jgi:cobyrinic acid a,c-diamide synthase